MQIRSTPFPANRPVNTGLTTHRPPTESAARSTQDSTQPRADELEKKQQEMQDSLARLKELSENTSAKQMAMERVAVLKQRLDTLKSIVSKLPPGDYKALLLQMKQIAKELTALSKQLGQPVTVGKLPEPAAAEDVATEVADAQVAAAVQEAQAAASETSLAEEEQAEPDHSAAGSPVVQQQISGPGNQTSDEKALRTLLAEARKTFKEVLALLKIKHQPDDRDTRALFKELERDMDRLQLKLQHSERQQHSPLAQLVSPEMPVDSGNFVDTLA